MADPRISYIAQRARQLGLDPQAVLAIAGHEGLSGGIGDGGHAFGPFQMNNAGGVLTGKFGGETPQQINSWAWSHAGIDSALGQIAQVARGLKGNAAIQAIATKFERPANPGAEIADAEAHYGAGNGSASGGSVSPSNATLGTIAAGGSLSRQQLAQLVFGQGNRIDFNSNQVQAPNLMALAQMRQQMQAAGKLPIGKQIANTAPAVGGGPTKAGGFLPGHADYVQGRIDQGHDFQTNPGGAIIAPGAGVVIRVASDPHGFGPSYPIVKFTSGPYAGHTLYVGHTLSTLHAGQTFAPGQVISRTGTTPIGNASVPGWAEIGYAPGGVPGSFGQHAPF